METGQFGQIVKELFNSRISWLRGGGLQNSSPYFLYLPVGLSIDLYCIGPLFTNLSFVTETTRILPCFLEDLKYDKIL